MKILIDNGHGIETPGKRSPDGVLREYAWNRLIASRIVDRLLSLGLDAELLVPEERDISLPERCRLVNTWCRRLGKNNVVLISIHVNAAGRGDRWYNATGWSCYTYYGHSLSDKLATCLCDAAIKNLPGHRLRADFSDGDPDIEAPYYILKHTICAAVLTENGFMDSEVSLRFLESEAGKKAIVALHVEGIVEFVRKFQF